MAAKEGPDGAGFEGPPQESKGEGKEEGFEPAPVAARAGRRRRAADEVPDSEAKDGPPPRRPSALQEGGWRLDGTGEPRGDAPQMKSVEADELPSGRRGRMRNNKHFDDENDDIVMIIPGLEDEAPEDLTVQVAAAPKAAAKKLLTLRELDSVAKYIIPSAVEGIDMSLLTGTLVPPAMLQEPDELWDFDSLLRDVQQEIATEDERAIKLNRTSAQPDVKSNEALPKSQQRGSRAKLANQ